MKKNRLLIPIILVVILFSIWMLTEVFSAPEIVQDDAVPTPTKIIDIPNDLNSEINPEDLAKKNLPSQELDLTVTPQNREVEKYQITGKVYRIFKKNGSL